VSAYDPVQSYKEIKITTANQIKLIVMLYDGAIRRIGLALECFTDGFKRYDEINAHLKSAQDIISELMASLDFEKGGELAKRLFSIYSYFNKQLLEANLKKDPKPLHEVKKLLLELREAWDEISSKKGLEERARPVGGVNIAG
jgi:flagellar secretion chaperone FliS